MEATYYLHFLETIIFFYWTEFTSLCHSFFFPRLFLLAFHCFHQRIFGPEASVFPTLSPVTLVDRKNAGQSRVWGGSGIPHAEGKHRNCQEDSHTYRGAHTGANMTPSRLAILYNSYATAFLTLCWPGTVCLVNVTRQQSSAVSSDLQTLQRINEVTKKNALPKVFGQFVLNFFPIFKSPSPTITLHIKHSVLIIKALCCVIWTDVASITVVK